MFVVEALFDFSAAVMNAPEQQKGKGKEATQKQEIKELNEPDKQQENQQKASDQEDNLKRKRSQSQDKELHRLQEQQQGRQQKEEQQENQAQSTQITYLSFEEGDKVLVREAYENGWWYGNQLKAPEQLGYFPSSYVKVGGQPPPPPPPAEQKEEEEPEQKGVEWINKQLNSSDQGAVHSEYYQGIKGYKSVRIGDNNKSLLGASYVRFDASTGMARVPIKDQAPTAKAVRQMGYYFDYHQWNEQRNNHPDKKARPDIRKKKQKKLNLKMMD